MTGAISRRETAISSGTVAVEKAPAREYFTSRWGLVVVVLGMAVGTGNIWRFPRVAAQNGGAAFIIAWIIAMFTWSLPILILEMGIGKHTRKGVVGAFTAMLGRRFAWVGGFVTCCTLAITCYYVVVAGWCLKYSLGSLAGTLQGDTAAYWNTFTTGWQPIGFHLLALACGSAIVLGGVIRGIERTNRVMIPLLAVLLGLCAVRAVTLPGAERGLNFLFDPDWTALGDPQVWLEALSQNAWSLGAGWGLAMTYAAYMREKEDITLNALLTGLGNNSASLLAAIAILCTVYAFMPIGQVAGALQGNEGLAFIYLPQLFEQVPGGRWLMPVFFLTLSMAALSSLIAMLELGTNVLMDMGFTRRKGVFGVSALAAVGGVPSALSMHIFQNQDWVWGLGLLLSGTAIVLAAASTGMARFCRTVVNPASDFQVGGIFQRVVPILIPLELVCLLAWWFYRSAVLYDPEGWWQPFHTFSIGTCLFQWGLLALILLAVNRRLADRIMAGREGA